jgi:hypothetical protein
MQRRKSKKNIEGKLNSEANIYKSKHNDWEDTGFYIEISSVKVAYFNTFQH